MATTPAEDKAAPIIADLFSFSVIGRLIDRSRDSFVLYGHEQSALDWLRNYRTAGGRAPISLWTASYMRHDKPPPWLDTVKPKLPADEKS